MPGPHTKKQRRQAMHIAASERARGVSPSRALSIGWATVNKHRKGTKKMASRKGQFKKGGGRVGGGSHSKKRKAHHSTALVPYRAAPVVYKTRHVTKVVKVRSKGGGKRALVHAHGGGHIIPGPFRLKTAGIASLVGYSEAGKGFAALQDVLHKLPTIGKLPPEAVAGALANYFAPHSEWLDAAATAFLDIAGYKVGQAGYSISGDDE